jgi:hypothetical protein
LTERLTTSTDPSFDLLIRKENDQLQPLLRRMDELRLLFVKQTVDFAKIWYEETARSYVANHSEITFSLGKEKIAQLKTSVNNLVNNAEDTVTSSLSSSEVWWHIAPFKNSRLNMYEQFEAMKGMGTFKKLLKMRVVGRLIRWLRILTLVIGCN